MNIDLKNFLIIFCILTLLFLSAACNPKATIKTHPDSDVRIEAMRNTLKKIKNQNQQQPTDQKGDADNESEKVP